MYAKQKCRYCKFWWGGGSDEREAAHIAECHRFPPTAIVDADGRGYAAFPETGFDMVCGELSVMPQFTE